MLRRVPWRQLVFLSLITGALTVSFLQDNVRHSSTAALPSESGAISSCNDYLGQGEAAPNGVSCKEDGCSKSGNCYGGSCMNCGNGDNLCVGKSEGDVCWGTNSICDDGSSLVCNSQGDCICPDSPPLDPGMITECSVNVNYPQNCPDNMIVEGTTCRYPEGTSCSCSGSTESGTCDNGGMCMPCDGTGGDQPSATVAGCVVADSDGQCPADSTPIGNGACQYAAGTSCECTDGMATGQCDASGLCTGCGEQEPTCTAPGESCEFPSECCDSGTCENSVCVACTVPESQRCVSDDQEGSNCINNCKCLAGYEMDEYGICVEIQEEQEPTCTAPGASCEFPSECCDSGTCENSVCVACTVPKDQRCVSDDQEGVNCVNNCKCLAGYKMDEFGICIEIQEEQDPTCTKDEDCDPFKDTCQRAVCNFAGDCVPGDSYCTEEKPVCQPDGALNLQLDLINCFECITDEQCGEGRVCEGIKCKCDYSGDCCEEIDSRGNGNGEIDDPSERQITRGSGEACGVEICRWCDDSTCNTAVISRCAECVPPSDLTEEELLNWKRDPGCVCSTPSDVCNAYQCGSPPYEGDCRTENKCPDGQPDVEDCWVSRNGKRVVRGHITAPLACVEGVDGESTCRTVSNGKIGTTSGGNGGAIGGEEATGTTGTTAGAIGGLGTPFFPNSPNDQNNLFNPDNPDAPTNPDNPDAPPSVRACPADLRICPDGSELARDPNTCLFPECTTHLECRGQACTLVLSPGGNTCSSDDDCSDNTHLTCLGQACVTASGAAANDCSSDDDCILDTHLECIGQTCTEIPGAGANRCNGDDDCELPTHLACENKACTEVFGAGLDECSSDDDCSDNAHLACENNACTILEGARKDTCSDTVDCLKTGRLICLGSSCTQIPQSGQNECATLADCEEGTHLGCENSQCKELQGSQADTCSSNADCFQASSSSIDFSSRIASSDFSLRSAGSGNSQQSDASVTSGSSQSASIPDVIPPNCGDGITDPGEECDTGVLNSNSRPNRCRLDCLLPFCGDGLVDSVLNETCDDANDVSGDGCSANCQTEVPASSVASQPSSSFVATTSIISSTDSNNDTSARSSRSRISEGFDSSDSSSQPFLISDDDNTSQSSSSSSSSSRRMVAAAAICGNGVLEHGEECDDSNRRDDDGCSNSCLLEIGICGDGIVQTLLGEQCEQLTFDTSLPYSCLRCRFVSSSCGDGTVDAGEECDEGPANSTSPDASCRPDCSMGRCGDGVLDSGEQCDDGNLRKGDGCSRICTTEAPRPRGSSSSSVRTQVLADIPPTFIAIMQQMGIAPADYQKYYQILPKDANGKPIPYQLPLAQLQPLVQNQAPIGDTGPAAAAVIGAGAAAGFSWMRRKKDK